MTRIGEGFPPRDERLGRILDEVLPVRARTEEEWARVTRGIVAASELSLARRRRSGLAFLASRARGFAAAAAVVLLVLGGLVYANPNPEVTFVRTSAELLNVVGEEELRAYFPGMDDTDRLLEAAFAAQ